MDHRTDIFNSQRKRLMGIAWRMLGSHADAQDVLQDAWLRWNESDTDSLRNPQAWLVTIVTRLAIDRLRAARAEREHYAGFWLPEPLVEASPPTPQQQLERADEVSVAFLTVLEQLAPEERAAHPPVHPGPPDGLERIRAMFPGLGEPTAVRLREGSPGAGRSLSELGVRGRTGATVLAISRPGASVMVPSAAEVLRPGDVLVLAGAHEAVDAARELLGAEPSGPGAAVAPPHAEAPGDRAG